MLIRVVQQLFLAVICLTLSMNLYAEANKGKPGDEFRRAAADYEDNADKAVQAATKTEGAEIGKYLKLSAVYREMAGIKHRAAGLADQGRWDDINWDRYHELEGERDQLLGKTDWGSAKKSSHKKSENKAEHNKTKHQSDDHGFLKAAQEYDAQAQLAREHAAKSASQKKAGYTELAAIFEEMAAIKREAASAADRGQGYDWSRYEKLSQRRDQIKWGLKKHK